MTQSLDQATLSGILQACMKKTHYVLDFSNDSECDELVLVFQKYVSEVQPCINK